MAAAAFRKSPESNTYKVCRNAHSPVSRWDKSSTGEAGRMARQPRPVCSARFPRIAFPETKLATGNSRRMPAATIGIILVATLITAAISGIFGMAGGLILMGVLTSFTPVATAMVLHGFIQIISNGSRAFLHRRYIAWPLIGRYAIGILGALAVIALVSTVWRPSQQMVFILLGLTAFLVWIPKSWVNIDVERPVQAELCGFLVQTLNTLAGVAGPLLDLFFVKTLLPRQTVVATKAATQVMAHAVKIAFWGFPLFTLMGTPEGAATFPPIWALACVVPLSLLGTWAGSFVLDRMTDANFRTWTKWIVTATGAVYLAQGVMAG